VVEVVEVVVVVVLEATVEGGGEVTVRCREKQHQVSEHVEHRQLQFRRIWT